MVNGEPTTVPQQVAAPEKKPGWIRHPIQRAKMAYSERYPVKPGTLVDGYPVEKATKQLESFVKKVESGMNTLRPEQRIEVMVEIHKIFTKYRFGISDDNKKELFELMAKLYTKSGTAEMINNSADKKVRQMGAFVFQLADLIAKGEGLGRPAESIIQSFAKMSFNHGDAMRFSSISLNMYAKPFTEGINDLGARLGVNFEVSEIAGFLHEAKNRGLFFSVTEAEIGSAKNEIFVQLRRLLKQSAGRTGPEDYVMRKFFNSAFGKNLEKGEHLTLDAASLAVLKSEEFQKGFLNAYGGRNVQRREALLKVLNQFIADIEEAGKGNVNITRLRDQMKYVLTGGGDLLHKNRDLYRSARDEISALYRYVVLVTSDKAFEQSVGRYALLAREAAAEADKLASAVGGVMGAVHGPMRGPKLEFAFFRRYLLPWAPASVARELGEALGRAPGLRYSAAREVKPVRRLAIWTAAYVGGVMLTLYFFKVRSERLEKALAARGGPLVPYLSRLDSGEKKFFRDNPDSYRVFSAMFWGPMEKLPRGERDLDDYFDAKKSPALPVINREKIKEFAKVFREWWEVGKKKGFAYEDMMRLLEPKVAEWSDPAMNYLKPGTGTKGGSLIFWFSQYYKLKPGTQRFLETNPEVFKMILIGLSEGTIAASKVPGFIDEFIMSRRGTTSDIKLAMDDRRRLKRPGSIRDMAIAAMDKPDVIIGRGKGYIYLAPVSEGSIVRYAELAATPSEKDRKRLDEFSYLYNTGAAKRLNNFIIQPGQAIFGDPIDLALKVARGEVTGIEDAKKKGYIGFDILARIGITKPATVVYINERGQGMYDWIRSKEKNIRDGQKLFDEFAVTQRTFTEKMNTVDFIKHIESQLKMDPDLQRRAGWAPLGVKRENPPELGAGVIPTRALAWGAAPPEVKQGKVLPPKVKQAPKPAQKPQRAQRPRAERPRRQVSVQPRPAKKTKSETSGYD